MSTYIQYDLFGPPTKHHYRHKNGPKSEIEKREEQERKEDNKRRNAEKKAEERMRKHHIKQTSFLDGNGEILRQYVCEEIERFMSEESGIHINPENKGRFTETQKETGKSTSELLHSKNPKTRQRANFARMARRHFEPLKKN